MSEEKLAIPRKSTLEVDWLPGVKRLDSIA